MGIDELSRGPLSGISQPVHGGQPDRHGCGGCTDCCHLPEIAVTEDETATLSALYDELDAPAGMLRIVEDPKRRHWRKMLGPCVFRLSDWAVESGGCRIYDDRPGSCRIFTCQLLLDLRRA
jgi:Fe-S-cluster containining protein